MLKQNNGILGKNRPCSVGGREKKAGDDMQGDGGAGYRSEFNVCVVEANCRKKLHTFKNVKNKGFSVIYCFNSSTSIDENVL